MENNEALDTLQDIKSIMERSSRFQSISGWSIIIIGIIATAAAYVAEHLLFDAIHAPRHTFTVAAACALLATLCFGIVTLTSVAKAKRQQHRFAFDRTVRRTLLNLLVPLFVGGLLCLALVLHGHYGLTSAMMLIFYGLALINCHHTTTPDIAILGYIQILLGLIDCFTLSHRLLFWTIGFGLGHILFGIYFTIKYDRK